MNLANHAPRLAAFVLPVALAAVAVVASGELTHAENVKVLASVIAAGLGLLLLYLSGNPRLFCLWALMVVVPLDLSKRLGGIIAKMGGENSYRLEFTDLFIAALVFYQLRDIWLEHRRGIRIPRVAWLYLAILLWCLLSIVAASSYRATGFHELFRMIKVGVLFIVVANELTTARRIWHAAAALLLGVFLQSCVGLLQFSIHGHLGLTILGETGAGTLDQLAADSVKTERSFRVGALLLHPNIFGAFLGCLLPLAIGLYLVDRRAWVRASCVIVLLTGVAALITTLSRSGWLSFFVATLLLAALMMRRKSVSGRMVRPALVAAALSLAVLVAFSGPIFTRLFESKPDAITGRAEYISTAWGMIQAKPIMGFGLNSYVFEAPPYTRWGARGAREFYEKSKNWLPPVHNIYLLWWSELGIVGLALHLAMIAWILRTAVRNLQVADDILFAINIACLVGIVALLVDAFLSFTLRINSVLRVFWVLSGMIYAVHYWRLTQQPFPRPP